MGYNKERMRKGIMKALKKIGIYDVAKRKARKKAINLLTELKVYDASINQVSVEDFELSRKGYFIQVTLMRKDILGQELMMFIQKAFMDKMNTALLFT